MATKGQIALLTKYIFDKLTTTEYHPLEWRTAIYAALLEGNINSPNIDYSYGNYNTWKIDHQWRGNINNIDQKLQTCNFTIINENEMIFECTFIDEINTQIDNQIISTIIENIGLKIEDFNIQLWTTFGPNNIKVLNTVDESAFLYNSLISVFINETEEILAINVENIAEEFNLNEIHPKVISFHHLYLSLFDLYNGNKVNNEDKSFFQTVLGAGLFYLPHPESCWDGRISIKAINNALEGGKLVKDHIIPRKLASKKLLELPKPLSIDNFNKDYWEVYSKFTYVTTYENYKLRNYYIDNLDYNTAATNLEILWFERGLRNPLPIAKDLKELINYLINNERRNLNIDELNLLVDEFILAI